MTKKIKRLCRIIKRYFKNASSTRILIIDLKQADLKRVTTIYSRYIKLGMNVKLTTY